jgi:hypothetical protein
MTGIDASWNNREGGNKIGYWLEEKTFASLFVIVLFHVYKL